MSNVRMPGTGRGNTSELQNRLFIAADLFADPKTFPLSIRLLWYDVRRRGNFDLFNLFRFFVRNGMPPQRAGYWILWANNNGGPGVKPETQYHVNTMVKHADMDPHHINHWALLWKYPVVILQPVTLGTKEFQQGKSMRGMTFEEYQQFLRDSGKN